MRSIIILMAALGCVTAGQSRGAPQKAHHMVVPAMADSDENGMRLYWVNPCGARFVGFLLDERSDQTLMAGVLVKKNPRECTSMGRRKNALLPGVFRRDYRRVIAINPLNYIGRPTLTPTGNIHLTPRGPGAWRMQLVYTGRCGVPAGIVIRPHQGSLKVTTAEWVDGAARYFCEPTQMVHDLSTIRLQDHRTVAPLQIKRSRLNRAYRLRVARASLTDQRGPSGFLRYKRRCNEAPIGSFVRPAAGEDSEIRVGVLLAHYYNYTCPKNSPKFIWSKWSLKDLHRKGTDILPLEDIPRKQLALVRPTRLIPGLDEPGRGATADYLGGCGKPLGTVIARVGGESRVGILQTARPSPCKKPVQEVSLELPWLARNSGDDEIKPLALISRY